MVTLKPNMYVRTHQGIAKIVEKPNISVVVWNDRKVIYVDKNGYPVSTSFNFFVFEDEITAFSFNIIDLIRFGDIIKTPKGKFEVGYVDNNVIYTLDSKVIACLRTDEHLCFENKIINSIITKEQFNACKYVAERDNQ